MNVWKKLFRFEESPSEFELLETEHGQPTFMGGWHEAPSEPSYTRSLGQSSLEKNEARLNGEYRGDINPDLTIRKFALGGIFRAMLVCMNGMTDAQKNSEFILKQGMKKGCMENAPKDRLAQYCIEHVFAIQEAVLTNAWDEVKAAVSQGQTVVFIEDEAHAIILDTRGFEHRSVDTAVNEKVIRGPQEGFNENLRTNVTLLRRIIKTDDFVCEFRNAGADNQVSLAIAYREGIANQTLVGEVKRRLARIETRQILSNGTIEQLIERRSISPFPQVLCTERPDRAATHIMQGHVVVLCDGSPTANVTPTTLFTLMASPEDSYTRRPVGTIFRFIRYLGAFLSVLLPGYFLALAQHHQGMLSTQILNTIIASRQMVFLSLGLEVIFLLLVFQLIREAGMRVPGVVGQAIGIIGGLLLGQAAVAANVVSTVVLILVAITGLGNFAIPDYSMQISAAYFRVLFVILAWMAGLLGLFSGVLLLTAWMVSIKSFGVPFLSPVVPKTYSKRPAILRGTVEMHRRANDYLNTQEKSS